MLPRLLLAALCLLPALARADAGPPTTSMDSSGSGSSGSTGAETMPPEYTPCGCTHDQLGGGWSLAVALLAAWSLRRRQP